MNYFDNISKDNVMYIEIAILAEDIELPELPDEPLSLKYLEENGEYPLAFNEYKDTVGNFYIPIMTPLIEKEEPNMEIGVSPSLRGHKGNIMETIEYESGNFIQLVIPKYILLNFKTVVPAGTVFIITSIGGVMDVEKMRIIGLYTTNSSEEEEGEE